MEYYTPFKTIYGKYSNFLFQEINITAPDEPPAVGIDRLFVN